MNELPNYKFRGARAIVLVHERYMREFLEVWREAKARGVRLPKVDDPDYESLDHLLRHVLRAARGYMTWSCEKLNLPDPGIDPVPEVGEIEVRAEAYLNHVLEKWRTPLAGVEEKTFDSTHKSRWGVDMTIESMLEHAVVHPLRHTFQLKELMKAN
jgi:uncharacterized damage-inducible protein DinB